MELRIPKYLSPSSLSKFEESRPEFFERYMSPIKTQRPPQMDFMAMGSAFDAFVKSQIHSDIHGEAATTGGKFDREKLFESQVEPHNRDIVWERAEDLWNQYVKCGAYGSLLADISLSPFAPEMEFTAVGVIQDIPLLGKPDLRYITKGGVHVISDWKVNGSMSKTGASPVQGYKICLDYGSKTHGKHHKKYVPFNLKDVVINEGYLETFCDYWADQLSIYGWLLGEPIGGEDHIIRMEQIACRPVKSQPLPRAKFATHMSRISKAYQESVLARVKMCWETILSGHIFTDVSRERSDEICEQLIAKAKQPLGLHPVLTRYANTTARFK